MMDTSAMKLRIFIGSSSERLDVANAVRTGLEDEHVPIVWKDGIFGLSKDILAGLLAAVEKSDAAVFIFAPDDLTQIRCQQHSTVRDNVVFELGLFMGMLGRERTFFVVPKGEKELHLPSDLTGVIYASYDPNQFANSANGSVTTACTEIKKALSDWMRAQAKRQNDSPSAIGEAMAGFGAQMEKVLLPLLRDGTYGASTKAKVEQADTDLVLKYGRRTVYVTFGRIDEAPAGEDHLVVLPANDLFDHHCFHDSKGAMGSCMSKWFPGRVGDVKDLVQRQLAQDIHRMKATPVATSETQLSLSYGVGKCVYINRPFGVNRKIALVTTSTKRANVGLHSEGAYLFAALRNVCHVMNDEKLDTVYLPVLGGGKGAMDPQIAFWYLLLALRHLFDASSGGGKGLRSVHIVIFKVDSKSDPEIDPELAGKLLGLAMR